MFLVTCDFINLEGNIQNMAPLEFPTNWEANEAAEELENEGYLNINISKE